MKNRRKTIASLLRQLTLERAAVGTGTAGEVAEKKWGKGVRRGGGYGTFKAPKWQTMGIGDMYRPLKKQVSMKLDADVLEWFKRGGPRYQTRINAALREVMMRELERE